MKKLQKSDLQLGDILIFEDFDFSPKKFWEKWNEGYNSAFYYLLDYLIAWFDPGKEGKNYKNIYHAGIWGNVDVHKYDDQKPPQFEDCVVQAGPGGIGCATLEDMLRHDAVMKIYVCRLKKQTENFHQEINGSIREFYKEKGHYSFMTAWMLAVICSMRYSKASLHKMIVAYCHSELLAHFIVEQILYYINDFNNRHQREMIACSPLVAMIYKNAGYELAVNVFESIQQNEHPTPNFKVKDFDEKVTSLQTNTSNADDWLPIQETVVTPRQLFESPDVEVIGYLPHMG